MSIQIEYFETMVSFSKTIMNNCIADSDNAVQAMSTVIEILLKDSSRISKMSLDTQESLKKVDGVLSEIAKDKTGAGLNNLIVSLSGLIKEHRSVETVVMPIIGALQFQDAIRQQMENVGKVMSQWLAAKIEFGSNPTAQQLCKANVPLFVSIFLDCQKRLKSTM